MQSLADILIVADKDRIYGVQKGYYPSIKHEVDQGNLILVPYEEWRNSPLVLNSPPRCNGEDVYIRNPYSNCYLSTADSELLDSFCKDKSYAIKEALVWMGAKHIKLVEQIKDEDRLNLDLNVGGKKKKFGSKKKKKEDGGSLNTRFSRFSSVDLQTWIEADDPERKPMSAQKVDEFLIVHGLANDTLLRQFAERLRINGRLSGRERYKIDYLNEVKVALEILANIDYKIFSANLDFSLEHNHLHTISKELEVIF